MSLELRRLSAQNSGAGEPLALTHATTMIGSLSSNQIPLVGPGIEPIHGMIERLADGSLRLTDLGSLAGIMVNGQRIDVDRLLAEGDVIEMGLLRFRVAASGVSTATQKADPAKKPAKDDKVVNLDAWKSAMLFGPTKPTSQGRMLEVVAYWGDTVLNVDHFHPDLKGFANVTIGDPTKAHFISGGKDHAASRVLANVEEGGAVLKLAKDMKARVRQDGKVTRVSGVHQLHLGPTDYAHIEHGAVRYFLRYANLPKVELPRNKVADAFFVGLSFLSAVLYLVLVAIALTTTPKPVRSDQVAIDTKPWEERYRPKDPVKAHQVEVEIKPDPKPPVKQPVPVKPTHVAARPPAVKPPVTPPVKPIVAQALPKPVVKPVAEVRPTPTPTPTPVTPVAKQSPSVAQQASAAPAGPKAPTPNFKPAAANAAAGPKSPIKLSGNSGGPGNRAPSGAIQGRTAFKQPGNEGGKLNTPSMANLDKLGVGLGKVLTQSGGLHADFRSSAGGAGQRLGSASRTTNLGGPGNGTTLGFSGNGGNLNSWGNGPGGVLNGGNGPGGTSLSGMLAGRNGPGGNGTGIGGGNHTQATVDLPAVDPVSSGSGLPPDAIMMVIRSHLNEIRHCYEQLLQRQPKAQGKVVVRFVIGPDGRVTTVSVLESAIPDTVMRGCLTGKIQRWPFPKPRSGSPVTVTYPFVFNPL